MGGMMMMMMMMMMMLLMMLVLLCVYRMMTVGCIDGWVRAWWIDGDELLPELWPCADNGGGERAREMITKRRRRGRVRIQCQIIR